MQTQRRLSIPCMPSGESLAPVTHASITAATPQHSLAREIVIGILNTSAYYNEDDIASIMQAAINFWGEPSKILLPLDGKCSVYIDSWAERNTKAYILPIDAEWGRYGSKACMMRQKKIEQESTHFLVIRSPRAKSDKILYRAEALCKLGKEVLLISGHDDQKSLIIDHYEVEEAPPKAQKKEKQNLNNDIRKMMGFLGTNQAK